MPTRATQRESTGNEAARKRRRLPAPPLSFSAENKVPQLGHGACADWRRSLPAQAPGLRRLRG